MYYCAEDELSRAVARRLADYCGPYPFINEMGAAEGGWAPLRSRLPQYAALARHYPVLILTDLDRAQCPPTLRQSWLEAAGIREPLPPKMVFCIARREVESWLLADREGLCSFLQSPSARMLLAPEEFGDPKGEVIEIARRSRSRDVREAITPRYEGARVGLGYNSLLSEFVRERWAILAAHNESTTLARAVARLTAVKDI